MEFIIGESWLMNLMERHAHYRHSLFLCIIIVSMSQFGYVNTSQTWPTDSKIFDRDNSPSETIGTPNGGLLPSVSGTSLSLDQPMTNITFQFNSSAINNSSSGVGQRIQLNSV